MLTPGADSCPVELPLLLWSSSTGCPSSSYFTSKPKRTRKTTSNISKKQGNSIFSIRVSIAIANLSTLTHSPSSARENAEIQTLDSRTWLFRQLQWVCTCRVSLLITLVLVKIVSWWPLTLFRFRKTFNLPLYWVLLLVIFLILNGKQVFKGSIAAMNNKLNFCGWLSIVRCVALGGVSISNFYRRS